MKTKPSPRTRYIYNIPTLICPSFSICFPLGVTSYNPLESELELEPSMQTNVGLYVPVSGNVVE